MLAPGPCKVAFEGSAAPRRAARRFLHTTGMRRLLCGVVLLVSLALSACGSKSTGSIVMTSKVTLSDPEIRSLETKKIFFGHQSVGDNILQGIRDIMKDDPRLQLKIVHSDDPESVPGPAFVETYVGENRYPRTKNAAFASILDNGMGRQGGIAFYKYCYVDFDSSTDVNRMFEDYRKEIADIKAKYPSLQIVHATAPLAALEPEPRIKTWLRILLGKMGARDVSAKRAAFNNLLRQTFAGKDPIFDLAEVESTYPDGSRSYFMRGNEKFLHWPRNTRRTAAI
jgi:hypothetical protein